MATQVPTSPNICFYTTGGKQNKQNMHRNKQQMSTNWRLDRIKIWSRWSELMRYIVYLLTIVLPVKQRTVTRLADVRVSAGQWVRETIELLECETPDFISLDLWPPTALTSVRSITSSGVVGQCHATAGLSDDVPECGWTQEGTGWNLDLSGAEHYWHCYQRMEKPYLRVCVTVSQSDRSINHIWFTFRSLWLTVYPGTAVSPRVIIRSNADQVWNSSGESALVVRCQWSSTS